MTKDFKDKPKKEDIIKTGITTTKTIDLLNSTQTDINRLIEDSLKHQVTDKELRKILIQDHNLEAIKWRYHTTVETVNANGETLSHNEITNKQPRKLLTEIKQKILKGQLVSTNYDENQYFNQLHALGFTKPDQGFKQKGEIAKINIKIKFTKGSQ